MLHKTRGIVFRTTKYAETSIIVKIFTETFGIQTYIINGARSSKSKSKAVYYQHGNLLDLVVYYKETGNIMRISDANFFYAYKDLPFNIVKSSLLLFYIEVINKTIKEHEAYPELFHFLFEIFVDLDETDKQLGNHHIWFLLALSKYLGFYPSVSERKYFDLREGMFTDNIPSYSNYISEQMSDVLRKIINPELKNYDQIKVTAVERKKLLAYLLDYYRLHLPEFGEIRSIQILEELFR